MSVKRFSLFMNVVFVVALLAVMSGTFAKAQNKKLTFYWISHGQAGDAIWNFALDGASEAAKALGVDLKSSFHKGDIASQKEAIKAAIAAGADGIAISSPQAGVLTDEVKLATSKGIPVVFFNTDDPATGRTAYVGADNVQVGIAKAKYLVDNKLIKSGDRVWMPAEVPGGTYVSDQTAGLKTVFDPLGIKYEVFDAGYDPAETVKRMTDYLTAHKSEVQGILMMGDLTTGFTQQVFDKAGIKPGAIPVVGWGNSAEAAAAVKAGYVNAGWWQFPDAQGYQPIYMLYEAKQGRAINYNVLTYGVYDKSNVDTFIELTKPKK